MRITTNETAQRSLTKQYWKEARDVLYKTAYPVIELSDKISPAELKNRVPSLLKPELMDKYILNLWSKVGGKFATDMVRKLMSLKELEDYHLQSWEQGFKAYMAERSRKITKQILSTEAENINLLIDKIVSDAMYSGEGISTISGKMQEMFIKDMVVIQNYEAERIARTEVIGASNKGSYDGALSTGLPIQKGWSTSGLSGIRQTHLLYESFGWVSMDKEFAPGLRHPGDPSGSADEIINCRCRLIYNVD